MRRSVSILIALSMAFAGCRAKEAFDKASIAHDLNKSGSTVDLLKDVSKDKYTAPADGKLTDAQIQMYLKVRDHERQIAQVAKQQLQAHEEKAHQAGDKSLSGMIEGFKGMGSVADFYTADIRAAKDLGYNTQEYIWVKAQVLAASTTAMTAKIAEAASAQMDTAYRQMKKQAEEAKDEQTKKMYTDMLATYEKQRSDLAQSQKEDPAMAYNRTLLAKYENTMNAVTSEVSKYEEKEGDAKRGMDEFNKGLAQAKAENAAAAAQTQPK